MPHLKYIKIFYDKQFTAVTTHKNVQKYYNEKCSYNANTHCSLLYALFGMFKLYSKEKTNFFA